MSRQKRIYGEVAHNQRHHLVRCHAGGGKHTAAYRYAYLIRFFDFSEAIDTVPGNEILKLGVLFQYVESRGLLFVRN